MKTPSLRLLSALLCLSCVLNACGPLAFWTGEHEKISAAGGQTPDPATVCSGTTINGVVGTANCSGSGYVIVDHGVLDPTVTWAGDGLYSSFNDTALPPTEVCSDTSIFGRTGTAICNSILGDLTASAAYRDSGSTQATLSSEVNLGTCSSGGYTTRASCEAASVTWTPSEMRANYRDIPNAAKDDEGYLGNGNTTYALRPTVNCGTSGSIATRIADCVTQNASRATWNGAVSGTSAESTWKLVTRNGTLKEVWQDQRTGLIWSSLVAAAGTANWCKASGNIELAPVALSQVYNTSAGTAMTGNGTITNIAGGSSSATETITITFTGATTVEVAAGTCGTGGTWANNLTNSAGTTATYSNANKCSFTLTQGSTPFANGDTLKIASTAAVNYSCAAGGVMQPASPTSYCAESGVLTSAIGTENWSTGIYDAAKGGMGLNSTDVVRWRLPTVRDYYLAEYDGIRFVMPDMGIAGTARIVPDVTGNVSTEGTNEWSASVYSSVRYKSWSFLASNGSTALNFHNNPYGARCVGR